MKLAGGGAGAAGTLRRMLTVCVIEPPVPVIVIELSPDRAFVAGQSRKVENTVPPCPGVTGLSRNWAVTRCGIGESVRFTGELKSPIDCTETDMFPHRPCLTISGVGDLGLALSTKSVGADATINVTSTLRVICGNDELAVMVTVYDPSGVISDVGTVRTVVTVPPGGGVTVNGEKLPTEPGGVPDACN